MKSHRQLNCPELINISKIFFLLVIGDWMETELLFENSF